MPLRPIRIKRIRPDVEIPKYQTDSAGGFDICTAEQVVLFDQAPKLVPTGLVIATPRDHILYITFRSSTPRKHGVTVLTGIIDSDYCGPEDEIFLQVMNLGRASKLIPRGTRLAQGIFMPITTGIFTEVDQMTAETRGGFGSTG